MNYKKVLYIITCSILLLTTQQQNLSAEEECRLEASTRMSASVVDLSELDFDLNNSVSMVPMYPSNTTLTSLTNFMLSAPLTAIGKVTYSNDAYKPALCSATLIKPNVILAPWDCLNPKKGYGEYFWPGSSQQDQSPLGSAKIIDYYYDSNTGVAMGLLDRNISRNRFWVLFLGGTPFYYSWKHGGYWNLSGYRKSDPYNPQIEKGCAVTKASNVSNMYPYDKYLFLDCNRSLQKLMDGSVMYSNLCGKWMVLGIKVRALIHTAAIVNLAIRALNSWNHRFYDFDGCDRPDPGNLSGQ